MATLQTRWLVSILLVNLPNCFASGPPAAPSPLKCYIPCDEEHHCADIHCSWDIQLDPQVPTNYSLHWKSADSKERHVDCGTSLNGIIHREHFTSHGDLDVWVQVMNQHGSAKSQEYKFNTAEIMKPAPPKVILNPQEPLEIDWKFSCESLTSSLGTCCIRHRTEADQVWLEDEAGNHGYTFDSPKPSTVYEFQVRCSCLTGLSSDWSAIQRIRSTGTAPVGELDVWRDCGISQTSSDCVLTWKKLPISQARGLILGYEVRLSYNNGTTVPLNAPTAEPRDRLACDELQCHINYPLKDVSSVSVSAYNAHGATVPSYLAMPIPGKEESKQAIYLKMDAEILTASWDLPSQLSDNLREYVVQYKQAGCLPGEGFDWVKVNKSQAMGTFKGQYRNCTPYQVSLFTISHSSKVHHLSSVIGYSLQGTPSAVPPFEVFSIGTTHATLLWEPVPLSKRNGVILYYQIVLHRQNGTQLVYNVSASPQNEKKIFKLQNLSPGQEYEVRIRAVTAAGPGENATIKFETDPRQVSVLLIVLLSLVLLTIIVPVGLYCTCRGDKVCPLVQRCFYEKVPDARNSHIFRHRIPWHQINDPSTRLCIPIYEPHPKISLLEVVEIQPRARKSSLEETSDPDGLTRPAVGDCQDDQREDAVTEECHKADRRYGREEYSKMLDSDEERDREEESREDSLSSSEEEQSTTGYERHFMPTAREVLEV